jgi:hypothetical protein
MTATFEDGSRVEIALAGIESILGTSSMTAARRSFTRVYMPVDEYGYLSGMPVATEEFKRAERFHDLTLRSLQAQFIQSAQIAGCNALHTVEQRMARWFLLLAPSEVLNSDHQ